MELNLHMYAERMSDRDFHRHLYVEIQTISLCLKITIITSNYISKISKHTILNVTHAIQSIQIKKKEV